jgi:predicted nucleic acid-binding protein
MIAVIDASVAAKWFFQEPDSDKARDLLEQVRRGQVLLLAPELLAAEIGSMLWKRVLREGVSLDDATAQYARFKRVSVALVRITRLVDSALQLALRYRHSIYDCLYVALALEVPCDLLTADERLYRTFRPSFPRVRLLHNWPA